MTPTFRKNPRPVGPVLPMSAHDVRYSHSKVMPILALTKWKFPPFNTGKA